MADTRFKKGRVPWNKKVPLEKVCQNCSTIFFVQPCLERVKCCSIRCARKAQPSNMKGRKHSQVTKDRISLSHRTWKQRNPTKVHWNFIEDRTKLKKDNYRNDSAHREWSLSVKNRDSWRCKISNGDCSGRVVAHHILPWAKFVELRYDINNGITLCHFHHPRKRVDEMRLSPYFQTLVVDKAH